MKVNKKSIILTFNLDNEFDNILYEKLISLKDVGISRQGIMKRIFYKELIENIDTDKIDEIKENNVKTNKKGLSNFFQDLEK